MKVTVQGRITKADPKESEGARLERRAVRDRLRRMIKAYGDIKHTAHEVLRVELYWILARQDRYDKVKGGLGKK